MLIPAKVIFGLFLIFVSIILFVIYKIKKIIDNIKNETENLDENSFDRSYNINQKKPFYEEDVIEVDFEEINDKEN